MNLLREDFERFSGYLPVNLSPYIAERYGINIEGRYGGAAIRNPFGKASGQLSLNARQVARDAEAGLGFVVLKTLIAQDEGGSQSMSAWAIPETRMRVDRIDAPSGQGWTVTWKGRGWSATFHEYLQLLHQSLELGCEHGLVVAPSVKYHLPSPGESAFRISEYAYTTAAIVETWKRAAPEPVLFEKDFSPTLAGDDRSREQEQILHWLRCVPDLIRDHAGTAALRVGIKLMNARFSDSFQVEMVRTVLEGPRRPPDFLAYANRLFDPEREFEGRRGVALGGPELSARNLRCLDLLQLAVTGENWPVPLPEISATGDILTGEQAVRYGLAGATSCQMHTLFQLPDTEFSGSCRSKSETVLHHLLFHPDHGLVVWMARLRQMLGRETIAWLDLPQIGKDAALAGRAD